MKVYLRMLGGPPLEQPWPEEWPPPQKADIIRLPGIDHPLVVHRVDWLPGGDGRGPDPFAVVTVQP